MGGGGGGGLRMGGGDRGLELEGEGWGWGGVGWVGEGESLYIKSATVSWYVIICTSVYRYVELTNFFVLAASVLWLPFIS